MLIIDNRITLGDYYETTDHKLQQQETNLIIASRGIESKFIWCFFIETRDSNLDYSLFFQKFSLDTFEFERKIYFKIDSNPIEFIESIGARFKSSQVSWNTKYVEQYFPTDYILRMNNIHKFKEMVALQEKL